MSQPLLKLQPPAVVPCPVPGRRAFDARPSRIGESRWKGRRAWRGGLQIVVSDQVLRPGSKKTGLHQYVRAKLPLNHECELLDSGIGEIPARVINDFAARNSPRYKWEQRQLRPSQRLFR